MRKSVILGILAVLCFGFRTGLAQLTINVSSIEATPGQHIEVEVRVTNFTSVVALQYTFQWDKDVLEFKGLKDYNPNVSGLDLPGIYNFALAQTHGFFTMAWSEASSPATLPNNALLYRVEFEVIGEPCQFSLVQPVNGTDPEQTELLAVMVPDNEVIPVVQGGTVSIPGAGCEQPVRIIMNSVTGPCGGVACIEFSVENFIQLGTLEYILAFDTNVIQFREFRNVTTLLPGFGIGSSINNPDSSKNQINTVWFHPSLNNVTLPDGTILYEACFDIVGSGGQFSDIAVTTTGNPPNAPSAVTIVSPPGTDIEHPVIVTPGRVTAECEIEGFALIAVDACGTPNSKICVDVQVHDFDDILAMEFSMHWDPNLLHFSHVENFNLPSLDTFAFATPGSGPNIQEGELGVAWFDLTTLGITVPDYHTIFSVCFDAVGPAGSTSSITFGTDPTEEVFFVNADSEHLPYTLVSGNVQIRVSCEGCELSYIASPTSPGCPGQSTGSINLTVTEDCPCTPAFLWSAPGNPTSEDISNIPAGIYTVTITCAEQAVIATITVTDPPPISVSGTVTHPDPPGSATGAINITVSGGAPPYTFLWSKDNITTEDVSGLLPGVYTVTITDSRGCVFVPDPFEVGADLSAVITHVTCPGGNNGAISLSIGFGTPPYTFQWNNQQPPVQNISGLAAGTYCVTVTDSGNNTRNACFTVNVANQAPTVTATVTHDTNENCQGAIDLHVTGGTLPISYSWSDGPTSQDRTGLCGGQYCVTITFGQGCTTDTCFTVVSGDLGVSLTAVQYGNYQVSCPGICDGEITAVVLGGTSPFTYKWSNNATIPDIENLCAGAYSITVTDASGRTATAAIVLNSPPPFTLSFISTNPSDYITADGAISAIVNGGTPPFVYQWTGPVTGSTASLNNIPAGTYTLRVVDFNGCEVRESRQLLPVDGVDCFTAMSVFTPNSDGYNDYFTITCIYDFPNRLRIFNRHGGLVFETSNYQNNWSGADSDNDPQPDGGYMWVLEVTRPDGTVQVLNGTVTLLRTAD